MRMKLITLAPCGINARSTPRIEPG
jgi:hypothetical protein